MPVPPTAAGPVGAVVVVMAILIAGVGGLGVDAATDRYSDAPSRQRTDCTVTTTSPPFIHSFDLRARKRLDSLTTAMIISVNPRLATASLISVIAQKLKQWSAINGIACNIQVILTVIRKGTLFFFVW